MDTALDTAFDTAFLVNTFTEDDFGPPNAEGRRSLKDPTLLYQKLGELTANNFGYRWEAVTAGRYPNGIPYFIGNLTITSLATGHSVTVTGTAEGENPNIGIAGMDTVALQNAMFRKLRMAEFIYERSAEGHVPIDNSQPNPAGQQQPASGGYPAGNGAQPSTGTQQQGQYGGNAQPYQAGNGGGYQQPGNNGGGYQQQGQQGGNFRRGYRGSGNRPPQGNYGRGNGGYGQGRQDGPWDGSVAVRSGEWQDTPYSALPIEVLQQWSQPGRDGRSNQNAVKELARRSTQGGGYQQPGDPNDMVY